ncbi:MAG: hypothetical protein KDK53_06310 [Maritimibacter sp.]|nr:hypothetical protein [Maritimibacter sp.]
MKCVVLGGYGGVGRSLCRALQSERNAEVIVAGPRADRARAFATEIGAGWADARAEEANSLAQAFAGARLVIVSAPVGAHIAGIGAAALDADADMVDILLDAAVPDRLAPLADRAAERGRVLLTQAGFHPGLPGVFIRAAALRLDRLHSARVTMAMSTAFDQPAATRELVQAVAANDARILEAGAWRRAGWRDMVEVEFGAGFGARSTFPLRMREIEDLGLPEMTEAGVWAAGFDKVTDNLLMPLAMAFGGTGWGQRLIGRAIWAATRRWPAPGRGVVFRLEAEGALHGAAAALTLEARADDAYRFTVDAVMVALAQLLDGTLPPGLHYMGRALDPDRALADLAARGVAVDTRWR